MEKEEKRSRGGARPGSGRKKGGHNAGGSKAQSTGRLVISCLESEEAQIKAMAKEANLSVSRFVINAVLSGRQ